MDHLKDNDVGLRHIVRNSLTEYDRNFKLINLQLLMCYGGLPNYLSKLSLLLFCHILQKKRYNGDDAKETKRIYNNTLLNPEIILRDFNSIKYSISDKNINTDIANVVRKFKELDDYNVFYLWEYNKNYICIIEREVGSWKIYNSLGCVIPKTIKKLIRIHEDIIACMESFEDHSDRRDIEKSFGLFLNKVILKMNPMVFSQIFLWDQREDFDEYCDRLMVELRKMDDYEGLRESSDFLSKVPYSFTVGLKRQKEKHMKKQEDVIKDIIPKNSKIHHRINSERCNNQEKQIENIFIGNSFKPKALSYDETMDPFENANSFTRFYRAFVRQFLGSQVKFEDYGVDTKTAGEILDILIENNKKDRVFLLAWLRHFVDSKLNGSKCFRTDYTSLKCLKDTFEKFNMNYLNHINLV